MKNLTSVLMIIFIIFAVIVIVAATLLSWREFHRMLHHYDDKVHGKGTPHIAMGRSESAERVCIADDAITAEICGYPALCLPQSMRRLRLQRNPGPLGLRYDFVRGFHNKRTLTG